MNYSLLWPEHILSNSNNNNLSLTRINSLSCLPFNLQPGGYTRYRIQTTMSPEST